MESFEGTLRKSSGSITDTSSPPLPSGRCPECEKLERSYENAVKQIRAVVTNRYESTNAKVRELRKWQDCRDRTLQAFYKHKQLHPRKKAA